MGHFAEHLTRAAPDPRVVTEKGGAGELFVRVIRAFAGVPRGAVLCTWLQEEFREYGYITAAQLQRYIRRPVTLPSRHDYAVLGFGKFFDAVAAAFHLDPNSEEACRITFRHLTTTTVFPEVLLVFDQLFPALSTGQDSLLPSHLGVDGRMRLVGPNGPVNCDIAARGGNPDMRKTLVVRLLDLWRDQLAGRIDAVGMAIVLSVALGQVQCGMEIPFKPAIGRD
jgi:hypothetical protein